MVSAPAVENAAIRQEATADGPIVFYDGDCGLCAKSVQFVIRKDKKSIFRFAPLQGETAKRLIGTPEGAPNTWTMILVDSAGVYERSTGALKILQHVKWGGPLPTIGLWIPRFIRDGVYRFIANIRYRVWGHGDSCAIPTKTQTARFLP